MKNSKTKELTYSIIIIFSFIVGTLFAIYLFLDRTGTLDNLLERNCTFEGLDYLNNSQFYTKDKCNVCTCKDGKVECSTNVCEVNKKDESDKNLEIVFNDVEQFFNKELINPKGSYETDKSKNIEYISSDNSDINYVRIPIVSEFGSFIVEIGYWSSGDICSNSFNFTSGENTFNICRTDSGGFDVKLNNSQEINYMLIFSNEFLEVEIKEILSDFN